MADVRQLRCFAAVAAHGSISAAALELTIGRGVRLTDAGQALAEEAQPVIAAFDAALERTRQAGRGEAGRLRVGFEATGAGELSTPARARFVARHPAVRVEPKRFDWGGEVQ